MRPAKCLSLPSSLPLPQEWGVGQGWAKLKDWEGVSLSSPPPIPFPILFSWLTIEAGGHRAGMLLAILWVSKL